MFRGFNRVERQGGRSTLKIKPMGVEEVLRVQMIGSSLKNKNKKIRSSRVILGHPFTHVTTLRERLLVDLPKCDSEDW